MSRLIFKMRHTSQDAVELTIRKSVLLMDRDNMEALGERISRHAIEVREEEDDEPADPRHPSFADHPLDDEDGQFYRDQGQSGPVSDGS